MSRTAEWYSETFVVKGMLMLKFEEKVKSHLSGNGCWVVLVAFVSSKLLSLEVIWDLIDVEGVNGDVVKRIWMINQKSELALPWDRARKLESHSCSFMWKIETQPTQIANEKEIYFAIMTETCYKLLDITFYGTFGFVRWLRVMQCGKSNTQTITRPTTRDEDSYHEFIGCRNRSSYERKSSNGKERLCIEIFFNI